MSKYILSAIVLMGLQLAHADEAPAPLPATDASAVVAPAATGDARDPAAEKSFFETRTFDEVQQELQAVITDDDSAAHGG